MDKKKKKQLLQDREDAISQLYQGNRFRSVVRVALITVLVECVSIKEITKWSQFEPIDGKLQRVIEVEKGKFF